MNNTCIPVSYTIVKNVLNSLCLSGKTMPSVFRAGYGDNSVEENMVLEYKRVVDYSGNLGLIADESSCLVGSEVRPVHGNLSPKEEVTYALGKEHGGQGIKVRNFFLKKMTPDLFLALI